MKTIYSILFGLITMIMLGGCTSFDHVVKEQNSRIASLQTQLGTLENQRVDLMEKQAKEKIAAIESVHAAKMEQVQSMTNYVWAIDQTNQHNPAKDNFKSLIGQYSMLSLMVSPSAQKPTPEFQQKYTEKYASLENQTVTEQQIKDVLTKPELDAAVKEIKSTALTEKNLNDVVHKQHDQLKDIEDQISKKKSELIVVARKAYEVTRSELEKAQDTKEFYDKLVWIFGGCSALAVIGAFVCGYMGNMRMAIYAGLAAAAFGGCAFLTVWLYENRWVLWVVFGGGIVCVAGVFIIRQGWGLRDVQLIGMAGKRDELARHLKQLGKTLADFGYDATQTIQDLDLHELEALEEHITNLAKQQTGSKKLF